MQKCILLSCLLSLAVFAPSDAAHRRTNHSTKQHDVRPQQETLEAPTTTPPSTLETSCCFFFCTACSTVAANLAIAKITGTPNFELGKVLGLTGGLCCGGFYWLARELQHYHADYAAALAQPDNKLKHE